MSAKVAQSLSPTEVTARLATFDERPIQSFTNVELADYLPLHAQAIAGTVQPPSLADEVGYWAIRSVGQPYRMGAVSTDLAEADCVTFTERCLALGCASDWPSYYRLLQRLRHKNGVVDVLEKNFFTLADWAPNNRWLLNDITEQLVVPTEEFKNRVLRQRFLASTRYGNRDVQPSGEHAIQCAAFQSQENAAMKLASLQEAGLPAVVELQQRGDRAFWVVLIHYTTHEEVVSALPEVRKVQPNAKLT